MKGPGTRGLTANSKFGPFETREEAKQHLEARIIAHRIDSSEQGSGRYWRGFIQEEETDL